MQKTKTIVRTVYGGATNEQMGLYNIAETENYVNSYLSQGWKLFNTHYVGQGTVNGVPHESRTFAWILLREDAPATAK